MSKTEPTNELVDIICVQPVADIISLAFQSSYLSDESNGVSILLIANAESAKTTLAHQYVDLPFVTYYDDITQKKLVDEFIPTVRHQNKKTLIIPDLVNSVEKQKVTRAGFLNVIKSGIDDTGITEMNTLHMKLGHDKDFQGTKFNIITAITQKALIDGNHINASLKKSMINSGLMSRFLPFSYNYPPMIIQKIKSSIFGVPIDNNDRVIFPTINQTKTLVEVDITLLQPLDGISNMLNSAMDYCGYGLRSLTNLKRLVKANALINNRTQVTQEDINKVLTLARFMNFKCNDI